MYTAAKHSSRLTRSLSCTAKQTAPRFHSFSHEGDIIDVIHESKDEFDGVVINAGAYTHYSYAIRDAIEAVQEYTPFVEVHMSDIHKREDFRKVSVITDVCVKQICGYGKDSYKMGIDLLMEII